jgi:hypothetical protein
LPVSTFSDVESAFAACTKMVFGSVCKNKHIVRKPSSEHCVPSLPPSLPFPLWFLLSRVHSLPFLLAYDDGDIIFNTSSPPPLPPLPHSRAKMG